LNGKKIVPEFSDAVSTYFNTLASSESFSDQNTVRKLNDWISYMTNGTGSTYTNMPVSEDNSVGMLVMNSVHFKGRWLKPFDWSFTRDAFFRNYDGSTSNVKMMIMKFVHFPYAEFYDLEMKVSS